MATVKENLIAAKALIDTPEKWGKDRERPAKLDVADASSKAFPNHRDGVADHLVALLDLEVPNAFKDGRQREA